MGVGEIFLRGREVLSPIKCAADRKREREGRRERETRISRSGTISQNESEKSGSIKATRAREREMND